MIYPVKVYRKHPALGGKVRRVISTRALQKRSDAMFVVDESSANVCNKTVTLDYCKSCGVEFPRSSEVTKYCSPGCSARMKRVQDKESGQRRRRLQAQRGGKKGKRK